MAEAAEATRCLSASQPLDQAGSRLGGQHGHGWLAARIDGLTLSLAHFTAARSG